MKKIGLFLLALLITGCSKNQEIEKENRISIKMELT